MKMKAALAWTGALAVLTLVFFAYTRPEMMVRVADFIWSCF
jgi:hypothetical protein